MFASVKQFVSHCLSGETHNLPPVMLNLLSSPVLSSAASVLPFVQQIWGNTNTHKQKIVLTNNCETKRRNKKAKIIKIQSKFDVQEVSLISLFFFYSFNSDLIKSEFCSFKFPSFCCCFVCL